MLILTILILVYWVAMLIQLVVNLATLPSLETRSIPSTGPFLSIIIPARNEEEAIETTVRGFLAQDYPDFELIVVDDRSDDRTPEILQKLQSSRLTVIRGEDVPAGWLGKPWALHQGSSIAKGELLLFADADITYAPNAVSAIVDHFLAHRVGVLSVFPRLVMMGFWENLLMPWLSFVALVGMPVWLSNRTLAPVLALGGGPGNLLDRATYDAVGGHDALRTAVIDDVGLVRLVRRSGRRSKVVRADHLVAVRMYRGFRDIINGFTKNTAIAMGNHAGVILFLLAAGVLVHLFPFILAFLAFGRLMTGDPVTSVLRAGLLAAFVIIAIRAILFGTLRYNMASAVFGHPIAAPIFLFILARSAWNVTFRKRLLWRGREYKADWVRFGGE